MLNSGAMFNTSQQPVLPFANLLCQKTIEIDPLPIGAKIKSFKIEKFKPEAWSQETAIKLPNFASLNLSPSSVDADNTVIDSFNTIANFAPSSPSNLRSIKRFWWHWLLSTSNKISILVLLILLQSSTQVSSLLERAKIYIDLDSTEAVNIPPSSRVYLEDVQASPFNRAIRQARKVELNSSFYTQAQEDIDRWSETILDIAKGRADEGDFNGAIAAAELVPQNHSSTKLIAQEATESLKNWQLRARQNYLARGYLIKAQAIINSSQASSYNQAIGVLQRISPEAEEYREAQSLISQWNEQIYLIAKQRAAQGDFKQAVEAAVLISEDSLYYQLAQDSINTKIKSIYGVTN